MAFSINKVTLVGNVARRDELRFTPSGMAVFNFSIATNRSVKSGDEWKDVATFNRIVVWGKIAEFASKSLDKGDKVYVDGRIESRQYKDKDGNSKTMTEIIAENVIPFAKKEVKPKTEQEQFEEDFPDRADMNENVDPDEVDKGIEKMKEEQETPDPEDIFP